MQENERITVLIRAAHTKTRFSYGAKRLQDELAKEGLYVGRDRIARLRREAGIQREFGVVFIHKLVQGS